MFVAASHCSKEDGYQHQLSSLAAHNLSRCLFKCSRMLSVSVQTGRPKRYNAQQNSVKWGTRTYYSQRWSIKLNCIVQ